MWPSVVARWMMRHESTSTQFVHTPIAMSTYSTVNTPNARYAVQNAVFVSPSEFVALKSRATWVVQDPNEPAVTSLTCQVNHDKIVTVK